MPSYATLKTSCRARSTWTQSGPCVHLTHTHTHQTSIGFLPAREEGREREEKAGGGRGGGGGRRDELSSATAGLSSSSFLSRKILWLDGCCVSLSLSLSLPGRTINQVRWRNSGGRKESSPERCAASHHAFNDGSLALFFCALSALSAGWRATMADGGKVICLYTFVVLIQ